MDFVITEYLRSLGSWDPGRELPSEGFAPVLDKLRGLLRAEMRRRGLLEGTVPRHLGIWGVPSWREGDAFEDLLKEALKEAFLRHVPGLLALVGLGNDVDAVVTRNLRNFLYSRQKQHDPVGFRIFEITAAAVESLAAAGTLHVTAGETKIRNRTLLAFTPPCGDPFHRPSSGEPPVCPPPGEPLPAAKDRLDEAMEHFDRALLLDIVTAPRRAPVEARLAAAVAELGDAGVEAFRFKDLVDVLKRRGREIWRTLRDQAQEPENGNREDGPARQDFHRLQVCMIGKLDLYRARAPIPEQLRRLWEMLRAWAVEGDDRPPPQRRMAEWLDVHPRTVRDYLGRLGRLVDDCREEPA